jgi:hypothetical protein
MLVASTREFREKQGQYLGKVAGGEDLILHSRKFGNFKIIPIVTKSKPRQGWAEAFQALSQEDLNERFFPDIFEDENLNWWEWEEK